MLRIEEIVGAMDDEFRYALATLSDERLVALKADQSALRRMRPVGVSTAEAVAMIDAIQAQRRRKLEQDAETERKRLERAAKRKATPRRKKAVVLEPVVELPTEPAPEPEPEPEAELQPEPEAELQPELELEPEPAVPVEAQPMAAPLSDADLSAKVRRGRLLLVIVPVLLTVLALLAS